MKKIINNRYEVSKPGIYKVKLVEEGEIKNFVNNGFTVLVSGIHPFLKEEVIWNNKNNRLTSFDIIRGYKQIWSEL
jgi:hypothetical protein